MAEKVVPIYQEAREVLDTSIAGLDPESKRQVVKAKVGSEEIVGILTPVLFPEDDDG